MYTNRAETTQTILFSQVHKLDGMTTSNCITPAAINMLNYTNISPAKTGYFLVVTDHSDARPVTTIFSSYDTQDQKKIFSGNELKITFAIAHDKLLSNEEDDMSGPAKQTT